MKRTNFLLLSLPVFGLALGSASEAQTTTPTPGIRSSQDVAPELIKARAQAENDLKQIHLLAHYRAGAGASQPPLDVLSIDSQYDDLVASVNGYVQAFAAAVQLPGPLDDAKWKSDGTAVIAQASVFDDSIKKIRAANAPAAGTRAFPLAAIASLLTQILIPGASGYLKVKSDVQAASAPERKLIADVFISAVWRDSASVLAPPKPEAEPAMPPSPAPSPAPSVK